MDHFRSAGRMPDWYSDKEVKCIYCHVAALCPSDFVPSNRLTRYVTRDRELVVTIAPANLANTQLLRTWELLPDFASLRSRVAFEIERARDGPNGRNGFVIRTEHGTAFSVKIKLMCPNCNLQLATLDALFAPFQNETHVKLLFVVLKDWTETVDLNNVRVDRPVTLALGSHSTTGRYDGTNE